MAKKDFDLAAAISGMVSDLDTNAPEVRMIPITDIIPNPKNFYKIDKDALKPLMDSIAMDGLHHYPLVVKHPEQEGKWQLIDGERRYTACRELVKEGNERFKTIPCTVKDYSSVAFARLQLILSNSTNRVLSPAEISRQAEETEMLFYQLKEEGHEFPGRMRDLVAAACNVSATKLARLKVIREGLHCDFMYLFEKDKLSEQAAYALARLPVELQQRISGIMGGKPPSGSDAEFVLEKYNEGWRWDAKNLNCPDGKNCPGGDRFLRHDLECLSYERCGGKTCCLNCSRAKASSFACDRMCSKAQALRKEKRAEEEAKAEKEKLKRAKPHQLKTMENARRLLKAIDAAGLADNVTIPWRYYDYTEPNTVGDIRKWAEGDFGTGGDWHGPRLEPENLEKPMKACKVLKCSADFLLGLTEELNPKKPESPTEGWIPIRWIDGQEKPTADQETVVGKFMLYGMAVPLMKIAQWKNGMWCFMGGESIEAECVAWWPIPEEDHFREVTKMMEVESDGKD